MKRGPLIAAGLLALAVPTAAQAFTPNDPLLPKQWYAPQDRAFDAFNVLPLLPTVRVAVIDSGVEVTHPDLRGQIRAARSFVGGSPADDQGHGPVVAAVGNNKYAPVKPWKFASYPAALPHVLGVGSYGRSGDVSPFSNKDPVFVDLVAPGEDMFSLFPRVLTLKNTNCDEQGYSSCGPKEYRHAAGTSFSAPQVSAAAATLFSLDPSLTPDEVSWLLERAATSATPDNGCFDCPPGRNEMTGWGKLNIAAAVRALRAADVPVADRFEPNDDVMIGKAVRGRNAHFRATVDYWDDSNDVYRIKLRRGQRVKVV